MQGAAKAGNVRITPLWVICVFAGISEVVAGVAIASTNGIIQIICIAFMCIFTSFIAAAFFVILWRRSEVLFSPQEFYGVDIERFVTLVGSQRVARDRIVTERVASQIVTRISKEGARAKKGSVIDNDERLMGIFDEIDQGFIKISFSSSQFDTVSKEDVIIELYDTKWKTVSDFLNDVYMVAISSGIRLPIWTYGVNWILKNNRTGDIIEKNKIGAFSDDRDFSCARIARGDSLLAVRL